MAVGLIAAGVLLSAVPAPARAARPPVVMIVLDEFPVDTLLDRPGHIDARRFPGFASLARHSTWFPNAYSLADNTEHAVPAILDGRKPRRHTRPVYRDHRRNAFTFFHRLGYRLRVTEELTRLCPPRLCPAERHSPHGKGALFSGRKERLEATIRAVRRSRRPTFVFQHSLLPHLPWVYLPSGQHVSLPSGPSLTAGTGFRDPFLTEHNEQRYLLQLGFVDREIGSLVRRMRRTGLLRRALLVVTADHGISFQLNVLDRRKTTERTVHELAPVPLFVKRPGQTRAGRNPSYADSADILPTMAKLLHRRLGFRTDGRDAFGRAVRARKGVVESTRDFRHVLRVPAAEMERRRAAEIARRVSVFGTGPLSAVYRIGPQPALLGRRAAPLAVGAGAVRARFAQPRSLAHVRPHAATVPTWVVGRLTGGAAGVRRPLALAVNGVIRATGTSIRLETVAGERFALLFPPSALRRGRDRIELYEIRPGYRLQPLGGR